MMSQEQLTQKELRGKVAQILSDSDLVINIGSRDGVMEGAKFAVLVPHPLEIHDPDSHKASSGGPTYSPLGKTDSS